MHKKELVDAIAARTSGTVGDPLTRSDVEKVVDALLETVTKTLIAGDKVQLTGFGSFQTSTRSPTNPQSGLKLEPREVPTFKAGKDLKDRVKEG